MNWIASKVRGDRLLALDTGGNVWLIRPDHEIGFVGQKVEQVNLPGLTEAEAIAHLERLAADPFL